MRTVLLQSRRPGTLPAWQRLCCESVRGWATSQAFDYQFCGDELFQRLPAGLWEKLREQPVVAADLARLLWLRECLESGYQRAIWCDADLLIFRSFDLAPASHTFGREIWVQAQGDGLRTYRRIHNAWLVFEAGDAILPFYIDRAMAMLQQVRMPVVPQFIGPKLLSALHNIVGFNVEERVGMLSPLAMRDVLRGGGEALEALRTGHREALCAVNLCASYVDRASDGVCHDHAAYLEATERLLAQGVVHG